MSSAFTIPIAGRDPGRRKRTRSCSSGSLRSLGSEAFWLTRWDLSAYTELGPQWIKIEEHVGRKQSDCRDRYRNHLEHRAARVKGPLCFPPSSRPRN